MISPTYRKSVAVLLCLVSACGTGEPTSPIDPPGPWRAVAGAPALATGRHSDVFFVNDSRGWLANTGGEIYRSLDGGAHWSLVHTNPAVKYRAIGFASEQRGWAGNLNDIANPTPNTALFETTDGGLTWNNISDRIAGPAPVGICGIFVLDASTIFAVGRNVGPAVFLVSRDGGESWTSVSLDGIVTALVDVYFHDSQTGIAVGAHFGNAAVVRTEDGGATWERVHLGGTTNQRSWKISFPTPLVGFASVERPNGGVVLKTSDGGHTWSELPVAPGVELFGIGFVTADVGWVAGLATMYSTADGGLTWREDGDGGRVNRMRFLANGTGFAAGATVYRFER